MRVDDRVLLRIRSGDRSPDTMRAIDRYVGRMSGYFARWAARATAVIDAEDLEQIGRMALLEAVASYRWRCPYCMIATASESSFVGHVDRRHPGSASVAAPSILAYCHGRVGRAMDHEVRRYVRRMKFHAEIDPGSTIPEGVVEPMQEHAAALAMVLRAVARDPDGRQARALRELARKEQVRWVG